MAISFQTGPDIEVILPRRRRRSSAGVSSGDAFTSVLLHFDGVSGSGYFPDSGAKGHNFYPQYGALIDTKQSKFGGSSLHVTSTDTAGGTAGGVIGDGSADLALGAGDFTVDLWYMPLIIPGGATNIPIIDWGHDTTANTGGLWFGNTGQVFWIVNPSGGVGNTTVLSVGTWYHLAVIRSAGNIRLFVNGVQTNGSAADATVYTTIANAPGIGVNPVMTFCGVGFFDEVRISKGTDRGWFGGFTPPSAPYTSDANTHTLLHFDGLIGSAVYTDSSSFAHPFTNVPNMTVVDTSQFRFGSAAAKIPAAASGTGYMMFGDGSTDMALGAGNFVVDFWFRAPSFLDGFPILVDWGFALGGNAYPYLAVGSGFVAWNVNNVQVILAGAAIPANTWTHIALVRSSGSTKLFINGVQSGSTFVDSTNLPILANGPAIGGFLGQIHAQEGWYDEFRISKGTDRGWFSGFSPPGAPYTS